MEIALDKVGLATTGSEVVAADPYQLPLAARMPFSHGVGPDSGLASRRDTDPGWAGKEVHLDALAMLSEPILGGSAPTHWMTVDDQEDLSLEPISIP